jgi:hypothetical protein
MRMSYPSIVSAHTDVTHTSELYAKYLDTKKDKTSANAPSSREKEMSVANRVAGSKTGRIRARKPRYLSGVSVVLVSKR